MRILYQYSKIGFQQNRQSPIEEKLLETGCVLVEVLNYDSDRNIVYSITMVYLETGPEKNKTANFLLYRFCGHQ